MSVAWERTHRRYEVVNAVLAEVAATGGPTALTGEIDEVYGDFGAFLLDVRRRWCQTFDARLDALLACPPPDLEQAISELRDEIDREQPAMRVLFDAHADHPALAALDAHHRRTLQASTGVDLSTYSRTA
jgi:hypothetical protein